MHRTTASKCQKQNGQNQDRIWDYSQNFSDLYAYTEPFASKPPSKRIPEGHQGFRPLQTRIVFESPRDDSHEKWSRSRTSAVVTPALACPHKLRPRYEIRGQLSVRHTHMVQSARRTPAVRLYLGPLLAISRRGPVFPLLLDMWAPLRICHPESP